MAVSKNGMLARGFFSAESRSPEVNRRGYFIKLGLNSQSGEYEQAYKKVVMNLLAFIEVNESVIQLGDSDVQQAKSFIHDLLTSKEEAILSLLKSYDVNQKRPGETIIGNKAQFSKFEDINLKKLGEAVMLATARITEIDQATTALNDEYVKISKDPRQKERCAALEAEVRKYKPERDKLESVNAALQCLALHYHPNSPSMTRHKLFSSAQKEADLVASSSSPSLALRKG